MKEYFISLFEYESWANNKILMYIEGNPTNKYVISVFSHLVADMKPWIMQLNKEAVPENIDCFLTWSVQQCKDEFNEANTKISHIVNSLHANEMKKKLAHWGVTAKFL